MNNLRTERTLWIFLLSSREDKPDSNDLRDLAFGIYCLESAKILKEDISLVVDCTAPDYVDSINKEFGNTEYDIYPSKTLTDVINTSPEYKHLVMFVLGHGSYYGIASKPEDISPHSLFSSVRANTSLKTATIFLGQCYAGIFNYMNAESVNNGEGTKSPQIVIMGATNLHTSIASKANENINGNVINWIANIFLFYIFLWFRQPIDMDGDSLCTLMDSFKFAGLMTNVKYEDIKISKFIEKLKDSQSISKKISNAQDRLDLYTDLCRKQLKKRKNLLAIKIKRTNKRARKSRIRKVKIANLFYNFYFLEAMKHKLDVEKYKSKRSEILSIYLFNHQDPWILHSRLAQDIEYSLK